MCSKDLNHGQTNTRSRVYKTPMKNYISNSNVNTPASYSISYKKVKEPSQNCHKKSTSNAISYKKETIEPIQISIPPNYRDFETYTCSICYLSKKNCSCRNLSNPSKKQPVYTKKDDSYLNKPNYKRSSELFEVSSTVKDLVTHYRTKTYDNSSSN